MRTLPALFACLISSAVLLAAQDGPVHEGSATVAKPRKPDPNNPEPDQEKIPSKLNGKNNDGFSNEAPTFKVDTNLVTLDVSVLDNRGHFIPSIPKNAFRVMEDDVPQQVKSFSSGEAPMTVAMVIEFSGKFHQYYYGPAWGQTLQAAYGFAETLKKDDYMAVIAYDMRPTILTDFTQDRMKISQALGRLRIPGFSECNLFDALVDAEERMKDIEGRKAILIISSGIDTFSKLTLDKARKKIQEDAIPIYAIGTMQAIRIMADSRMGGAQRLEFDQADNQLRTFSKETGGQSYFPRFIAEFPGIFQSINESLRNQYTIGYSPSNIARDGKYRKIKIQLVNPATNEPLRVVDEKGKPIKYQIIAKAGYTAPHVVD